MGGGGGHPGFLKISVVKLRGEKAELLMWNKPLKV